MNQDAEMVRELLLALPEQPDRPSGAQMDELLGALVEHQFDLRKALAGLSDDD